MALPRLVEHKKTSGKASAAGGKFLPPTHEISTRIELSSHQGDVPPDMPWDFPPGSPGSRHTGAFDGGDGPKGWVDRIRAVDPNFDLAWQPVSHRWVIWRYKVDGSWTCVMAVENPNTGERMELNQLFVAYLFATDPNRFSRARDAFEEVRDMARAEKMRRRQKYYDAVDEADHLARMHAKIGTHGKGNKAAAHTHGFGKLPDDFKM